MTRKKAAPPRPRVCATFDCRIEFIPVKGKRYHSINCGRRQRYLKRRKTPVEMACPWCKTVFTPKPVQRFCTEECQRLDYQKRSAKRRKKYLRKYYREHRAESLEYQRRVYQLSAESERARSRHYHARAAGEEKARLDVLLAHLWEDNDGRDDAEASSRAMAQAGR